MTARNLCAINWCKVNHKGTVGQFASYWDNLDAVAKKGYDDRSKTRQGHESYHSLGPRIQATAVRC
ncbi:hypothetical protein BDR05DRAFT_447655 [Suillus weaverae]|nr:hypothetical protein BDR05DRAFT_447655 [Suillus weaverae]